MIPPEGPRRVPQPARPRLRPRPRLLVLPEGRGRERGPLLHADRPRPTTLQGYRCGEQGRGREGLGTGGERAQEGSSPQEEQERQEELRLL